jgi:hypothetical protein
MERQLCRAPVPSGAEVRGRAVITVLRRDSGYSMQVTSMAASVDCSHSDPTTGTAVRLGAKVGSGRCPKGVLSASTRAGPSHLLTDAPVLIQSVDASERPNVPVVAQRPVEIV